MDLLEAKLQVQLRLLQAYPITHRVLLGHFRVLEEVIYHMRVVV